MTSVNSSLSSTLQASLRALTDSQGNGVVGGNLIVGSDMSPKSTEAANWVIPVKNPVRVEFMDRSKIWAAKAVETTHDAAKGMCYLPAGQTSVHGAYQTHLVKIDPTKTYDISIWMFSTGTDLDNYLGFKVYDKDKKNIGESGKSPYHNLYFKSGDDDSRAWVLHTGKMYSHDTNVGSGVRDAQNNYKFPKEAAYLTVRFLTCYGDGSGTGYTLFAFPSVRETWSPAVGYQWATMRSMGRINLATTHFENKIGTKGTNPSPWYKISKKRSIGFVWHDYYSMITDSEELVARVCVSYTDMTGTFEAEKQRVVVRLKRIEDASNNQVGGGAANALEHPRNNKKYPAGEVFWYVALSYQPRRPLPVYAQQWRCVGVLPLVTSPTGHYQRMPSRGGCWYMTLC